MDELEFKKKWEKYFAGCENAGTITLKKVVKPKEPEPPPARRVTDYRKGEKITLAEYFGFKWNGL